MTRVTSARKRERAATTQQTERPGAYHDGCQVLAGLGATDVKTAESGVDSTGSCGVRRERLPRRGGSPARREAGSHGPRKRATSRRPSLCSSRFAAPGEMWPPVRLTRVAPPAVSTSRAERP